MRETESIPSWYMRDALVLGCGNVLFGDDGFGPRVVEQLQTNGRLPENAEALDVGTGVREILFTILLAEKKPRLIVLVDCADRGGPPGALRQLAVEEIPATKQADLSLHQVPTSNLLRELRDGCGVAVVILVVQPECIPEVVRPGLSPSVVNAVQPACQIIGEIVSQRVNLLLEGTCDGNREPALE